MSISPASAAARRPSLRLVGTEPIRAAWDVLRHLSPRSTTPPPRGDGHTVVLFPGLATDGRALWPLRRHLNALGYHALDWGDGFNTGPAGDVDGWLLRLADDVFLRAGWVAGQPPISLVGWSLGGFYAREIAKLWPARVRRVVTIGTPFNGGSDSSNVGWLFRLLNRGGNPASAALRQRLATPPDLPTTAIYSRSDGVVAWQACRHERAYPNVSDIEVAGSHLGMGFNRAVLDVVARELARPAVAA
jgi:pimeloyl-ACP methyl ester carboxylesterase